jgi:hypothetical protein
MFQFANFHQMVGGASGKSMEKSWKIHPKWSLMAGKVSGMEIHLGK